MASPWLVETLPPALRTALVHGSEGAGHLVRCADLAAGAGLYHLAGELSLAAWLESPLDAGLAARAAHAIQASEAALPSLLDVARNVVSATVPPGDVTYYRRLADRRDSRKIRHYLAAQAAREPGNIFWDRLALTHALDDEDWDWTGEIVQRLPAPLAGLLAGDAAMLRGDVRAALDGYAQCAGDCPGDGRSGEGGSLAGAVGQERLDRYFESAGRSRLRAGRGIGMEDCPGAFPGLEVRVGLALLASGDEAGAARLLRAGLVRQPWRTQALLALHDLLRGRRGLRRELEGRVEILLYTWNKAGDIDRTLAGLHASHLGQAHVTVLNNGSTDGTGDVLAGWQDRFGAERFETVTLPVNVGAPAARNWLMSRVKSRGSGQDRPDWVVFLDDDVSLPPDWLGILGAARSLYPGAGVWGARVKDFDRPAHVQSADVFLEPEPGSQSLAAGTRRFSLSSCHHQTLDRGQFAYARPCATVTGCCHLFEAATLFGLGGFDLRYSPSQYDDLDHDVRLLLSGKTPVCQGHLAVGHFKSTGSQGGEGQAQYGVGFANQYKLHQKFSPEEFLRAAETADTAAWEDLLAKRKGLEEHGE